MPKHFIYQLLPRLWRPQFPNWKFNGSYSENGSGKLEYIDKEALGYIKNLGANIVWLTGVIHHATNADFATIGLPASHPAVTKGKAGSPYAIIDYYTISPTLVHEPAKRMDIFAATVKRIHKEGLQVLIDFVPNHVARQYHSANTPKGVASLGAKEDNSQAFSANNNFYYLPNEAFTSPAGNNGYVENPAKATGNDAFTASPSMNDWYETIKLNYGVDRNGQKHFSPIPATWFRMQEILEFWLSKGVDGFRCDMVEMVPVEFWAWVLPLVRQKYPNAMFVGEAYNEGNYGDLTKAGFTYLYDKSNFYNQLEGLVKGRPEAGRIPQVLENGRNDENYLIRFWENHDEVRLANARFAGVPDMGVPAMTLAACSGKEAVMLYFGQELGESALGAEGFGGDDGRTSIFDFAEVPAVNQLITAKYNTALLPESNKRLHDLYSKLGQLIQSNESISKGSFYNLSWANSERANSSYFFLRYLGKEIILFGLNFHQSEDYQAQLKLPSHAMETMGIQINSVVKASTIFNTAESKSDINFYWEMNGLSSAAPVQISALGVQVWKLTTA